MQQAAYKRYLLFVLMAIMASHYLDRVVLGVVMQDVQSSLDLNDTQVGLLSGLGFALFYSIMGIPVARWADRGNRVLIISVTAAIWSAAVALSGMARNYTELLLIRIAVAAAEGGCMPPAYSLLGDTFSRVERPRASAIYMLGLPIALLVGYFAAGWLNEAYGWRMTLVLIGVPGLALALLAALTLQEPRSRRDQSVTPMSQAAAPSLRTAFVTLFGNSTFRQLCLFICVWYFCSYALFHWQAIFFIRIHGLDSGAAGAWLALVFGAGALLGTWLGGEWGARYAANNEQLQLIGVVVMFSAYTVFVGAAYLVASHYVAFALLAIGTIVGNMCQGPILATIQTLVPSHMRAMSLALLYFIGNLVGMGLGPLAAGALSDALRPWAGEESLRYALIIFCPGHLWAAWHLWRASQTIVLDVAAQSEAAPG
ncbi:MFS transporter [Steroidobacter agaridevorans]|uniref:MFS transporter n=1 Tax=Steroidobacter agaridevorans TaxID=2695856 RepID=A0A829Y9F0_9GAMM|nr:MFS transporter [Steroidobacter agaridevorans]GFE79665.1 MFS transporter [Steroidobacter agaridevorans]GFE90793.1 MFS transporter [Steroidobacter agaridevorans]